MGYKSSERTEVQGLSSKFFFSIFTRESGDLNLLGPRRYGSQEVSGVVWGSNTLYHDQIGG